MTYPVLQPMSSLLVNGVHHFATCWEIERTDGTFLRFTDHDRPMVADDGETYSPTDGLSASAREHKEGTRGSNIEVVGTISDSAITHEDLRAGLYRAAVVREFQVDWRTPWAGRFRAAEWHVTTAEYTDDAWQAQVEDLIARLRRSFGSIHTRECRWSLGAVGTCDKDLGPLTVAGEVTSIDVQRRAFRTDADGMPDHWFEMGLLTWTSGNNVGLGFEVRGYLGGAGIFALHLKTPRDIQVGDEFEVYPGCDKTADTCRTKFDNISEFGGFPFIMGTDNMYQVPEVPPE